MEMPLDAPMAMALNEMIEWSSSGGISRFSQKIADPQTVNQVIGHVQNMAAIRKRHGEQAALVFPFTKSSVVSIIIVLSLQLVNEYYSFKR